MLSIHQSHDETLSHHDVINKEVEEFKSETNKALGDTRDCLKVIDTAVKDLPNTLQLSATQIYIRNDDTDADDNDTTSAPTVHDSLHLHTHKMNELEVQTSSEINRVVEWVTNQKQNDETKLNALAETVEQVQLELQDSVSQTEVDEKISIKVRELVDQIKEALLTVEDEEADFKNVASTLHALFNSLKESKADKSEMNQLRNQIINTQLNGGSGSNLESSNGVGGTLDYKGLRKILSSYSKTDLINKQLEGKADKDLTASRLAHSSNMIDKILETIDELWFVIKKQESASSSNTSDDRGEDIDNKEQLTNTITSPSESIRSLVSIEEPDQSHQTRSKSFSLNGCGQLMEAEVSPSTTRPRTLMSLQRDGSSSRLSQSRPGTSPSNLSYYLTPKDKRRSSLIQLQTGKDGSLFVGNISQCSFEDEDKMGETRQEIVIDRPRSSSSFSPLQFFKGRATAL